MISLVFSKTKTKTPRRAHKRSSREKAERSPFLSTARTHFDVETTTTTTTTTSSLPPPTYRAAAAPNETSLCPRKEEQREKRNYHQTRSSLSLDVFFYAVNLKRETQAKKRSDNMCAYVLHQNRKREVNSINTLMLG